MALGTGFIWAQLKANRDKIKFCYPREKITSFVLITASGTKMILWHWQDEFQDKFCWQDLVGGCYCLSEVWGGERCAETGDASGGGLWLTMGLGELCLSPSDSAPVDAWNPRHHCDEDNLVGGGGLVFVGFTPHCQDQANSFCSSQNSPNDLLHLSNFLERCMNSAMERAQQ